MAWTQETTSHFVRQRKHYVKKHSRELAAVERNLRTYFTALSSGAKPLQIKNGFVHVGYPGGFVSIDQKGGGGNLAQTRLYVYPDVPNEVLWLLTIGDMNTQPEDVKLCAALVAGFAAAENDDEPEEATDADPTGGEGQPDPAGEGGAVQDDRGDGA